jgi:hypothetical protein
MCAESNKAEHIGTRIPLVAAGLAVFFSIALVSGWTRGQERAGKDQADPQSSRAVSPEDAKNLVGQLGNDQFSVRESATNSLIQIGVEAKPILVAASNSNDAEVKLRARSILSKIVDADFQRRLAAFEADRDGSGNTTLPGWSVFKETIGSDREARELFVDMQKAETQLFDAYEQGPEQALEALKERSQKAWDNATNLGRRGRRPAGNVNLFNAAAMLFVGSDPRLEISDEIATRLSALPTNETFRNAIISGEQKRRQLYRTILGRWVARDMSLQLLAENLSYASNYSLKEALVPALKTLKSGEPTTPENSRLRTNAMLLVGKLGSREHIKHLEPFFSDTHLCLQAPMQVQMRDLALWVTVKLYGRDPRQFGFDRMQSNDSNGVNLNTIAFNSDEERQAAFKKWEALKAQR